MTFKNGPLSDISEALKGNKYRDRRGAEYTFVTMVCMESEYQFYFDKRPGPMVILSLEQLEGLELVTEQSRTKQKSR